MRVDGTPLLLSSDAQSAAECYAVKVRSRSELSVARQLGIKGYKVLTPSYMETRRYSDRIKKVDRALFPGYVFVWLHLNELLPLLSTQGVDYLVRSGGQHHPLPAAEIAMLEAFAVMSEACQPYDGMKVGHRVRIDAGPLCGYEGLLVSVGSNDRIVISIESISSSVSLTISDTAVTILSSAPV